MRSINFRRITYSRIKMNIKMSWKRSRYCSHAFIFNTRVLLYEYPSNKSRIERFLSCYVDHINLKCLYKYSYTKHMHTGTLLTYVCTYCKMYECNKGTRRCFPIPMVSINLSWRNASLCHESVIIINNIEHVLYFKYV